MHSARERGRWRTALGSGALTVLLVASLPAGTAAAQVPGAAEGPDGGAPDVVSLELALKLELARRYAKMARDHRAAGQWERAAVRYERAAELSAPLDSAAARYSADAAHGYHYAGRPADAARMWERAGRHDLRSVMIDSAATHLVRAALAAKEAGDRERSSLNGLRALHLLDSPALDEDRRAHLRRHLQVRRSRVVIRN